MEDKYVFEADWFNAQASLTIKMRLSFYKSDRTIELFNITNKKLFLKRTSIPELDE
jgi:nucleoside-diphosphate kinase